MGRKREKAKEEEENGVFPPGWPIIAKTSHFGLHNSVVSLGLTKDYKFIITGRFQKPLHRHVVKFLNITRVEQEGRVKVNNKITWKVKKELMN